MKAICMRNVDPIDDMLRAELHVGEEYEVKKIHLGESFTMIKLGEFGDRYNSVMFRFVDDDGNPVNIYRMKIDGEFVVDGCMRFRV